MSLFFRLFPRSPGLFPPNLKLEVKKELVSKDREWVAARCRVALTSQQRAQREGPRTGPHVVRVTSV